MKNAGNLVNRRQMVQSTVAGSLIFQGLLGEMLADDAARSGGRAAMVEPPDPLAPRSQHFPARAKSVIFLFMSGGVSHVDSFDPKPRLIADHGREVTFDHPETRNRPGYEKIYLKRPDWAFRPRGQSGIEVSDLFPHIGGRADDLTVIRSMHTSHSNHYNATLGMHTGSFAFSRPSIGAWMSYGLGTSNRDLPGFVVIAPQQTYAGTQVYAADFLPAANQGTLIIPGPTPVANVAPRVPLDRQRDELAARERLDRGHLARGGDDPRLAARIRSFETAFGMQ
ncbi:MAG: DUF1501 domain-containing protein, partial [Isosphaeraceae bacterium]